MMPEQKSEKSQIPNSAPSQRRRTTSSSRRHHATTRDRRIDPKQIPRPRSQLNSSQKVFHTRTSKGPPPLSDSDFICVDEGNAPARYARMTLNHIPRSRDLLKTSGLPVAVHLRPFAPPLSPEEVIPTVPLSSNRGDNQGDVGPPRCNRCGAYINCFAKFSQASHGTWECNLCGASNELRMEYHGRVDAYGKRLDAEHRPELSRGAVDFAVPASYTIRPAQKTIVAFVLDVSYVSVATGLMDFAAQCIRKVVEGYKGRNDGTRVGLITYSDAVHFYDINFSGDEEVARVVCMPDAHEPFGVLPPSAWTVAVSDEQAVDNFFALLDQLQMLYNYTGTASAAGVCSVAFAAKVAAQMSLERTGGKLVCLECIPGNYGLGALHDRERTQDYGEASERAMYTSQNAVYADFAKRCARSQVCVDHVICSSTFADIATLSLLSEGTGGQMFFHQSFSASNPQNCAAVEADILSSGLTPSSESSSTTTAYEAVIKVRCSRGLVVDSVNGAGAVRSSSEMDVPWIGQESSFWARFKYESSDLPEDVESAYVQVAVLHTTARLQQRIVRVFNLELKIAHQLSLVFRHASIDAVVSTMFKTAITAARLLTLREVRDSLMKKCITILYAYRRFCATHSASGQLILPESLKHAPLYTLAMKKSVALRMNSTKHDLFLPADERALFMTRALSMPCALLVRTLYPTLFHAHRLSSTKVPKLLWPSSEHLQSDTIAVVDAGTTLWIWVGANVDESLARDFFGVPRLPVESEELLAMSLLPRGSNDKVDQLHDKIDLVLQRHCCRAFCTRTCVVTETSFLEGRMLSHLVEDKTKDGQSYVEMLCTIHKKIQKRILSE
eukprot:g3180.t1